MSTQVYLNPTPLSILSIARDKYWLFSLGILNLLYRESMRTSSGYSTQVSDDNLTLDEQEPCTMEPESSDFSSGEKIPFESAFKSSPKSTPKTALEVKTEDIKPSIDNSSKQEEDLLLQATNLNDLDFYDENYFFHIAFTPNECTIICSTTLMNVLFKKPLQICSDLEYDDIHLLKSSFLNIQVDSDGSLNNSNRILQLTKPLAENNIPLFFLSTHFNDNILIPFALKDKVVDILSKNMFQFSDISNSYISTDETAETASANEILSTTDLELSTFNLFEKAGIKPIINSNINLLLTGARSGEINNTISKFSKILSSHDLIPQYIAITRTSINEVSLILPKSSTLRSKMGFKSKTIIGSTQDVIIPISIDFSRLPLDSTGIVSGVASKLINGLRKSNIDSLFEMNYLSMARSGIIMIPKEFVSLILEILQ